MKSWKPWTKLQVATLRKLWSDKSAAQIAKAIGDGITRNAVIGKAHRLDLPTKPRATQYGPVTHSRGVGLQR